jgi:hypothetical protein
MSHLLRVLVAVSVFVVPGAALAAGCEKDTDCKGDRVCERGACVAPGERATPPPPPERVESPPPPPARPPPAAPARRASQGAETAWEANTRKNVLSYNVLATVDGILTAADIAVNLPDPGLSIMQLSFIYERAVMPHLGVFGTFTPGFWTDPAGLSTYAGLSAGAKYYFFGDAPNGLYAGGELGLMSLNLGAGIEPEVGWQWVTDFGLVLAAVAGATFTATGTGVLVRFGLNGQIGWNF